MTLAVQDLRCELSAPLHARRWTADCLRARLGDEADAGGLLDDTLVCVSELVTNAVAAGCSILTLQVSVDDDVVRVSVLDDAPGLPVAQHPRPDDRSGRGLRLVEALSRRWGVDPAASGKEVWAELPRSA